MSVPALRRIAYYIVVITGGLVVHQHVTAALLGGGLVALLRRNSEAYVLMLLPIYWELFCREADPDGGGETATVGGRTAFGGQAIWFAALLIIALLLQANVSWGVRDSLPQSIVTLGEAFVAMLAVTIYLGWSRGIIGRRARRVTGSAVVSIQWRAVYYVVVVAVAILAEQSWVAGNVWPELATWLQTNSEAYAAMVLIPAYFDVIASTESTRLRALWYGGLLAMPFLVQAGLHLGLPPRSWFVWLETTTEAFIAAFVVSAYFDVIRGRRHLHDSTAAAQRDSGIE
jgi:hypothetical protein